MNFNDHSNLEGQHALLSASKYHWINYEPDDIVESYRNSFAQAIGTSLHDLARSMITHKVKMTSSDKRMVMLHLLNDGIPRNVLDVDLYFGNLMNYINDAIGYGMQPETVLYYSDFCFGTADAINPLQGILKNRFLRIHDLKTGRTPAHMEQLQVYAALFCLEYKTSPLEIDTELRIYQGDDIVSLTPDPHDILDITNKIIAADKMLRQLKSQED